MKVFVSWAGEPSKTVALALRRWLPDVLQDVDAWMSATDLDAGVRWGRHIDAELAQSSFGVLCLTRTNQGSPWILFEAGALAKTPENTHVHISSILLHPKLRKDPSRSFKPREQIGPRAWIWCGPSIARVLVHFPKIRSEEHTSELQPRFGISYPVFC